jgi:2-oxoisovalerate dehydrogenase E2 component (dihydrolipoyl transacylase)
MRVANRLGHSGSARRRLLHGTAELCAVRPFLLADIGEGIAEVELLKWHVKEGDVVKQFDVLCDVQSDKANVEITSRFDGVVTQLGYKAGDIARVGAPLLFIDLPEDGATAAAAPASRPAAAAAAPPAPPPPVGAPVARAAAAQTQGAARGGKVLTTPAVRHIARNHDLDLSLVPGTGPGGRILKGDVLAYLESGAGNSATTPAQQKPQQQQQATSAAAPAAVAARGTGAFPADRTEPVRGIKRLMVQSMTQSLTIPHFVYADEFEMSTASQVRRQINDTLAKQQQQPTKKLSYMPLVLKAASLALSEFPILNSSLSPDLSQIVYHGSHNIGVAMDTPAGLLVPNIKNVQALSLQEISDELHRLQEAGTAGKLSQEDQQGTTFSLSNIGAIGGTYAVPVIASPQVHSLRWWVGGGRKRWWWCWR